MAQQLVLIERGELEWRIDDHTRDVGRRGLAEARRVLRQRSGSHDRRPPSRPRAA